MYGILCLFTLFIFNQADIYKHVYFFKKKWRGIVKRIIIIIIITIRAQHERLRIPREKRTPDREA